MASVKQPRSTRWCFTRQCADGDDAEHFWLALPEGVRFIIWQQERAPDTGKLHVQGYIAFKTNIGLKRVQSVVGANVHCEIARGDEQQNVAYCSKEDSRVRGPWRFGEEAAPGKRTDLADQAARIVNGESLVAIARDRPDIFAKYGSNLGKLAVLVQPPPSRRGLEVITIMGESGIGKTWSVFDLAPETYRPVIAGPQVIWWDGYNGQDVVCFDDFAGQLNAQQLFQYLDEYPLNLPFKGGFTPARYTKVFITTNRDPADWYGGALALQTPAERAALLRRVGQGDPDPCRRFFRASTRTELHDKLTACMVDMPGMRALLSVHAAHQGALVVPPQPQPAQPDAPSSPGDTLGRVPTQVMYDPLVSEDDDDVLVVDPPLVRRRVGGTPPASRPPSPSRMQDPL